VKFDKPPKDKISSLDKILRDNRVWLKYGSIGVLGLIWFSCLGYWGNTLYQANRAYADADQLMAVTQAFELDAELSKLKQARNEVQNHLTRVNQLHALPGTRPKRKQEVSEQLNGRLSELSALVERKEAQIQAERDAQTAFSSARGIAKLAANRVQNPPHQLEIWETALGEWARAVELLESVSPSTTLYEAAQAKLTDYRVNRDAIAQRLEVEKAAIASYDQGRQPMDEAVKLSRKTPYGLADIKAVEIKVTEALRAFQSIPSGTGSSGSAQNRITSHTEDLQKVQAIVNELASCDPSIDILDCEESFKVRLSVFSDSEVTYGDMPVRASRSGSCDCPYDTDSSGNRCGDRSAYSRPGGRSPTCYK
jgi:hypothetical protein